MQARLAKLEDYFNLHRPVFLILMLCLGLALICSFNLRASPIRSSVENWLPYATMWGLTAIAGAWFLKEKNLGLTLVIIVALIGRIMFVGAPPYLSDDLYRYLAEGWASNHGINPFITAPEALPFAIKDLTERVNHPHLTSIYPPLAQLWFRIAAVMGQNPWPLQALTMTADLFTVGTIWAWRSSRQLGTWPALLYALHPLPILESAVSAHIEVPAVAVTAGAIYALHHNRDIFGGWLVGIAVGLKLFPATLLPALLKSRHVSLGIVLSAVTVLAASSQILEAGIHSVQSLTLYMSDWSFNGFLYSPLRPWLLDYTRPSIAVIAAALVTFSLLKHHRDPLRLWYTIGLIFLFCTPTAHPWYALWVFVPGLMLGKTSAGILGLSMLSSYWVLTTYDSSTGAWTESGGLYLITWLPIVVALVWEATTYHESTPKGP